MTNLLYIRKMVEISGLFLLSVFIGIIILALKTGLGCGLANLRKIEVVYIAFVYLILSIMFSYLVDVIPLDITLNILALGVTMHLIIALGLIYFGIHTKKEWLSHRKDISRKTFLWLSIPCPMCLIATFLACLALSKLTTINNLWIGIFVGVMFFLSIFSFSFVISSVSNALRIKNPSVLGNVMLLFGLFYLLSILIIPAYIQTQNVLIPNMTINMRDVIHSSIIMSSFVILGFVIDAYKRRGGR